MAKPPIHTDHTEPRGQSSEPSREDSDRGITRGALNGLLWTLSGSGVHGFLRMAMTIVLARLLTPSDFGLVGAALVVVGLCEPFYILGTGEAVVQRHHIEPRHIRTCFTLSLISGFSLTVLLWFLAPAISVCFRMEGLVGILRVLIFVFPIASVAMVAESLLRRELAFSLLARIQVGAYLVGYGAVGLSLALLGWGTWALVFAYMGEQAANCAILLFVKRHEKRPQMEWQALKELVHFGSGITMGRLLNYIALQGDNLVVGRFLGAEALGIYGRAYNLMASSIAVFSKALSKVIFPVMAKVQNDPQRLAATYRRSLALMSMYIFPLTAFFCIFAPELVATLLGHAWLGMVAPLQILSLGMLFRASYKVSASLAIGVGAVYHQAWRRGAYAVAVMGGAWIGQHWGVNGVSAGVLVALACNFILMTQLSMTLIPLTWLEFWGTFAPGASIGSLVVCELFGLAVLLRAMNFTPVIILGVSIPATIITMVAALLFMPRSLLGKDGDWLVGTLMSFVSEKCPIFARFGQQKKMAGPTKAPGGFNEEAG